MKSPPIEWEDLINIGMSPDAQIFTDQEGFGVIPKQPILIVQLLGMMFASPPPSIEENKDDYLRHIRNALISLSDYTQLSDYPISQDKKQEWKIGRAHV